MRLRREGEPNETQQSIEEKGWEELRANIKKDFTKKNGYSEKDLDYVERRFGVSSLIRHLSNIYEHMLGAEPGGNNHLQDLKQSVCTCYLSIRKQLKVCRYAHHRLYSHVQLLLHRKDIYRLRCLDNALAYWNINLTWQWLVTWMPVCGQYMLKVY